MKTDLHIHSVYSDDGEFTPAELVRKCADAGIEVMAVCDHNTVKGVEEALMEAWRQDVRMIPGIEIDCVYGCLDLHILGYGIDYQSPDFEKIESNIRNQTAAASKKRLELVRNMGFDISGEELESAAANPYWKDSWTGELIAEVLLSRPEYQENSLLRPYREGGVRSGNPLVNFYWDYCSQGKPCYVPWKFPKAADVIDMIHRNGGKAVLAHPGNNLKDCPEVLADIAALGLDGLEAYSSYHTPDQCAYFRRKAEEAGLIITCGSDYHGRTKPSISLGGHGLEENTKYLKDGGILL